MENKNYKTLLKSKYCNLAIFFGDELLIWGDIPFTKYKKYEIQINSRFGRWSLYHISSFISKRILSHTVWQIEYSLGPYWANFNIYDIREWDYHTGMLMEWSEYEKLPEHREGKPKYKERKEKEKWYFSSKFLKIYNLDFLNDPYGITIDFAWFPLLIYSLIQVGIHPRNRFNISFEADFSQIGPKVEFEICLFSVFLNLQLGKNIVVRKPNLKRPEDFNALIKYFANPYISDGSCNILQLQIQRKNKKYIENVLEKIDVSKFDTDEIIIHAMYKDWYRSEIFDLLLEKINKFDNWEDIEQYSDCYNNDAITKLNDLKTFLIQ